MAELKRQFVGGKMNKDVDERVLPSGEYRDALNIQVSTTDNGNAGSAHNLLGNALVTSLGTQKTVTESSAVVAAVPDEANNCMYFMIAAPTVDLNPLNIFTRQTYRDMILRVQSTGVVTPVVIDEFATTETAADFYASAPTAPYNQITAIDGTQYRVGMEIIAYDGNGSPINSSNDPYIATGTKIADITGNTITLDRQQTVDLTDVAFFYFKTPPVLNFSPNTLITSVNVLEDLLMWSDNLTEPKMVNIPRSIQGTPFDGTEYTHTRLILENVTYDNAVDLLEEHITTIRKAPLNAPVIEINETDRPGETKIDLTASDMFIEPSAASGMVDKEVGDEIIIDVLDNGVDFRPNDVLLMDEVTETNTTFRLRVLSKQGSVITAQVISKPLSATSTSDTWSLELEQRDPMFELKFPRFAFRYKYEDNQYSTISPWSKIAFVPGTYDYDSKRGYNLGMTNRLRSLVIRDILSDPLINPDDISAVDVLYKSTDSPNVYVVQSITKTDPEWDDLEGDGIRITSELIYSVLAPEQLLRPWDVVPRYARAQEVVANRLVYGNYVQGYDIPYIPSINQSLLSRELAQELEPEESVKSMRTYKWGMVIGDKYGRETPILTTTDRVLVNERGVLQDIITSVTVKKENAPTVNSFRLQQHWADAGNAIGPPSWAEYVRFYVKETSNEYYNLVMSKWYLAEDGNIWISFQSADRNKLDEESYIILKSENGTEEPVDEPARYKVLAIKNEAPDFIKLDRRVMGRVGVAADDVQYDADFQPLGLVGFKEFDLPQANWGNFASREDFKGIPKVRIVAVGDGNEMVTEWRTISRLSEPTSGDPTGDLQINTAYGDTANFPEFFVAQGLIETLEIASNELEYFFEFMDEVVENKPEFDGKFFVKIERDEIADRRILSYNLVVNDYVVRSTAQVAHLDTTTWTNPAATGPEASSTLSGSEVGEYFTQAEINSGAFGNPTSQEDHIKTWGFWNNWLGGTDGGIAPTRVFIDNARCINYTNEGSSFNAGPIVNHVGQGNGGLHQGAYYDNTLPENGTFNRIMFGVRAKVFQGEGGPFRQKMLEQGTLFRFREDPNQNVYKIEGPIGYRHTILHTFQPGFMLGANLIANSACQVDFGPDGWTSNSCTRAMFYTTFKRINLQTGATLDEGIDIAAWDPRGEITHDGETTMSIDILEPLRIEQSGDAATNLSGVFETEPKENAELDIFYEATPSIPLVLNNDNTSWFAPVRSTLEKLERNSEFIPEVTDVSITDVKNTSVKLEKIVGEAIISARDDQGLDVTSTVNDIALSFTAPVAGTLDKINMEFFTAADGDSAPTVDIDIYEGEGVFSGSALYSITNVPLPNWGPNQFIFEIPAPVDVDEGTTYTIVFSRSGGTTAITYTDGSGTYDEYPGFYVNSVSLGANVIIQNQLDFTGSVPTDYDNLFIDDIVTFKQPYGLKVTAKIKDHMSLSNDIPVPSARETQSGTLVSGDATLTGVTDTALLSVGMAIYGTGIPAGTRILSITSATELEMTKEASLSGTNPNLDFVTMTNWYEFYANVYRLPIETNWFNCYTFGNGVESNRVRDDFNAPTLDNGVAVSTTDLNYGEKRYGSSLIWSSGLFNAMADRNDLNEFSGAQGIFKDLNPDNGTIQIMKARDTDLIVFAEDKVIKILADKDALFNADGSANITSTDRVLGQAIPFRGDYGISRNPESLAVDEYRMYFTDKARGAVLRLSQDGLTPISRIGMKDWFLDNLRGAQFLVGTYDTVANDYNLSIHRLKSVSGDLQTTVTFNENNKGWTSFKSFVTKAGGSVDGVYFTTDAVAQIWKHYDEDTSRNNFYDVQYDSTITFIFNDMPGMVKAFKAMNYEGTQSKITQFLTTTVDDEAGNTLTDLGDGEYYNLEEKRGWSCTEIKTDLEQGHVPEFKDKEGKWFNRITGEATTTPNVDTNEFNIQGLGFTDGEVDTGEDQTYTLTVCEGVFHTMATNISGSGSSFNNEWLGFNPGWTWTIENPELSRTDDYAKSTLRWPAGTLGNYYHYDTNGYGLVSTEMAVVGDNIPITDWTGQNYIVDFADYAIAQGVGKVHYVAGLYFQRGGTPNEYQEHLDAIQYLEGRGLTVSGIQLQNEVNFDKYEVLYPDDWSLFKSHVSEFVTEVSTIGTYDIGIQIPNLQNRNKARAQSYYDFVTTDATILSNIDFYAMHVYPTKEVLLNLESQIDADITTIKAIKPIRFTEFNMNGEDDTYEYRQSQHAKDLFRLWLRLLSNGPESMYVHNLYGKNVNAFYNDTTGTSTMAEMWKDFIPMIDSTYEVVTIDGVQALVIQKSGTIYTYFYNNGQSNVTLKFTSSGTVKVLDDDGFTTTTGLFDYTVAPGEMVIASQAVS